MTLTDDFELNKKKKRRRTNNNCVEVFSRMIKIKKNILNFAHMVCFTKTMTNREPQNV